MHVSEDVTRTWVENELAAWAGVALSRREVDAELRAIAARSPAIVLYDVQDGHVRQLGDGGSEPVYQERARQYRHFLQACIAAHDVRGSGLLAISVQDRHATRHKVPVFEFQKERGANTILLPDVDLLALDFYEAPEFQDGVAFQDKRPAAIFVGSTTGGTIDEDTIRTLAHPRLRAFDFFRDAPDVTFALPGIDPTDAKIAAALRAFGAGGPRIGWRDQAAYRFMLSMDGYGAPCSRVALALHWNSVLVKYNSPYLLYYFHGLEPWRHYIPVRRDPDVLDVMAGMSRSAERDAEIAARSTQFARDHLNRRSATAYTAELLERYFSLFGG